MFSYAKLQVALGVFVALAIAGLSLYSLGRSHGQQAEGYKRDRAAAAQDREVEAVLVSERHRASLLEIEREVLNEQLQQAIEQAGSLPSAASCGVSAGGVRILRSVGGGAAGSPRPARRNPDHPVPPPRPFALGRPGTH